MKRLACLLFLAMLATGFRAPVQAQEAATKAGDIVVQQAAPGQWRMIDPADKSFKGIIKKLEQGGYSLENRSGRYVGVIRDDRTLQKGGKWTVFTPEDAEAYLAALKALEQIR